MIELPDREKDNYLSMNKEDDIDKEIEKKIRMGFIKKVYGIIFFQVLLTTLTVITSIFYYPFYSFLKQNESGLTLLSAFLSIITMAIIVCNCCNLSRKVPFNYIILLVFTLSESIGVSIICSYYENQSVFRIALITLALVFAISLYAWCTKTDFTVCGFMIAIIGMSLFICSIIVFFFHSPLADTIICGCESILFCVYLIYDTQLVIGNKSNLIKTDDFINGAMQIYIDIIGLFIKLLRLFGKRRK